MSITFFQFEAEENQPPCSKEGVEIQTKSIQGQVTCNNKLKAKSSENKIKSANKNADTIDKLKDESVAAEKESEFARVFAQLRGEKRWDGGFRCNI